MPENIDVSKIIALAREAGAAIMEVYRNDFDVEKKADRSPITLADKRANDILTEGLKALYPDIPVISEESSQVPYDVRSQWQTCWMVDPLDGTKEFINKNGEFTVNIALIEAGEPVLGVVFIPEKNLVYHAAKGAGAFKIAADGSTSKLSAKYLHYSTRKNIVVVGSRSHQTDEVKQFVAELESKGKNVNFTSAGSSLKFCLIAEGAADVYPRFGPTMEWDTAAAQIIATEAGRKVLDTQSRQPLVYNKPDLLNPWFIVE